MNAANLSRRGFLKVGALAGGGLLVGFTLPAHGNAADASEALAPNAFLRIGPDNTVTFYNPAEEMGQGVDTGLGTLVAEELDVTPWSLKIARAPVDKAFINPELRLQVTGGSTSIKAHFTTLREAAARTRALILQAASRDLALPLEQLRSEDGHVLTASGERYPYARFIATAADLPLPRPVQLKANADFKYIGRDFPRLDGVAKATGTALYSIDVDLPDMHHAVVVRCPVAGGTLASFDATAVLARSGVTEVVAISSGVAVVARHFWQAKQAAADLQVEWDLPKLAGVDTATVRSDLRAALDRHDGVMTETRGDAGAGLAHATHVVEREYWAPYLAHAPLEPMNATVRIADGKADVWSGTQGPVGDQGLVARALGMSKDDVTVHNTYMGGAFGRRGTLNHVVEAAEVAAATGRTIQLVWTREDDIRNGVYRPASLMRVRAGVDDRGRITGWEARRAGGNMMPTTLSNHLPGLAPRIVPESVLNLVVAAADKAFADWTVDHSSIEGLADNYDFPNRQVRHVTVDHGLPLTFWRSVGHSYTAFAKECMIDELAVLSGIDPVTLRLRNTVDHPRLANVIRLAGEHLSTPDNGRARGLAAHGSFDSHVAQVAEVSLDAGRIRVHKVICVIDCGQVVNPDIVRSQMEGSIMFGLTAALHGNLELKDGAIVESNFHDYPILRMNEAPSVEVIIVDSEEPPTGVGEPALPPIAPAVANAVYAASGQRLRALPLKLA